MDMISEIDEAQVRRDFAVTRKTVYMNNGAIAPTPLSTIKAMTDFMLKLSEEGPDAARSAEYVNALLDEVRTRVAHLINCERDEIVLTQSTTQGINMVAGGLKWIKGNAIVLRGGRQEHYANYLPWVAASQQNGLVIRELAADETGRFDLGELEKAARGSKLIAMSHVLYNTGTIMPLEQVGRIAKENNALLCVDAAQSAGSVPIDVKKMGCHFLAFPGFKWLCGPTGIGIFYCSKNAAEMIEPTAIGIESATLADNNEISNFEMPARFQAGFRNYPGAAGLESSLRYILRIGLANIRQRNMLVARVLRDELGKMTGVKVYGPEEESERSSIVTFQPPPAADSVELVNRLEKDGIVLAARAVGGKKAVRAAPHFFNNEQEALTVASYVKSLIAD